MLTGGEAARKEFVPAGGEYQESGLLDNDKLVWCCCQQWLCHSMWLFLFCSAVKIRPFSSAFPLAGSKAKVFCWLFLGASRKKHQPFPTVKPYQCHPNRKRRGMIHLRNIPRRSFFRNCRDPGGGSPPGQVRAAARRSLGSASAGAGLRPARIHVMPASCAVPPEPRPVLQRWRNRPDAGRPRRSRPSSMRHR